MFNQDILNKAEAIRCIRVQSLINEEYLTFDEVKKLAATPCKIPVLKQASLFACMTGLRISDILKLDWRDFEVGQDQGYYIRICTTNTSTYVLRMMTASIIRSLV